MAVDVRRVVEVVLGRGLVVPEQRVAVLQVVDERLELGPVLLRVELAADRYRRLAGAVALAPV